jgi:hypothetical protein
VAQTSTSLSYSASPSSYTGTDSFNWNLGGSTAYVRFDGTALTAGNVHVTMLDGKGQVVFDEPVTPGNVPTPGPTRQSSPGEWQVRLDFTNASGMVKLAAACSGCP